MKILYFASLRESLKRANEEIDIETNISVSQLKEKLIEKHGKTNFANNILCAVNQEIATDDTLIKTNDEVAFYPPVTGG